MKRYKIDFSAKRPVVQQVASYIRTQVAKGAIKKGSLLPSVREMGADLGINFNTVAKAYRILEKQGLVEIRHGLGTRVVEDRTSEDLSMLKLAVLKDIDQLICNLQLAGTDQEGVVDIFAEAIGEYYGSESSEKH